MKRFDSVPVRLTGLVMLAGIIVSFIGWRQGEGVGKKTFSQI